MQDFCIWIHFAYRAESIFKSAQNFEQSLPIRKTAHIEFELSGANSPYKTTLPNCAKTDKQDESPRGGYGIGSLAASAHADTSRWII
jgi:hypothetical protein